MVCSKCGGSQKLPFYRPDGTLSPHTFIDCDCYIPEREVRPAGPDDFDFPMSALYRRHSFASTGAHDPAYNRNEPEIRDLTERLAVLESSAQVDEAQQIKLLRLQVKGLTNKLAAITDKPISKSYNAAATKKSAYRGLRNAQY